MEYQFRIEPEGTVAARFDIVGFAEPQKVWGVLAVGAVGGVH
jgi:hypothetical protein